MGVMKKQLANLKSLKEDLEAVEALRDAFRRSGRYKSKEDFEQERIRDEYAKSMDEMYSGGTYNDKYLPDWKGLPK